MKAKIVDYQHSAGDDMKEYVGKIYDFENDYAPGWFKSVPSSYTDGYVWSADWLDFDYQKKESKMSVWGKIECIKTVRAMTDYGLVESKGLVETWMNAQGIEKVETLDQVSSLIKFVRNFKGDDAKLEMIGFEVHFRRPNVPTAEDVRGMS